MAEGTDRRYRVVVLGVALMAAVGVLVVPERSAAAWPTAVESFTLGLEGADPTPANVRALAAGIAAKTTHGSDDNAFPPEQLPALASRDGAVKLTCSYVSDWLVSEATELGWQARVVQTLTLDEWNHDDNGHTLVEVEVAGEWRLYDADLGVTFHDPATGAHLSLAELIPRVEDDSYALRFFDPTPAVTDEGEIRSRFRRVMQWPLIVEGGLSWYPDDGSADADRVGSYSERYQPESRWVERFY